MTHNLNILLAQNELKDKYVIYELYKSDMTELLYIGACPLVQLFQKPDVVRNIRFRHDVPYIQIVTSVYNSKTEALQALETYCKKYSKRPDFNKYSSFGKRTPFTCDQTGETFQTLQECARAHCVDPGALSKHLGNKPGFKTIKGRTYSYNTTGA